jgi:thiol-disulfide isomerase/thioredoxin
MRIPPKGKALVAAAIFLAAVAGYWATRGEKPDASPGGGASGASASRPAPEFSLKDPDGKEHSLQSLRGSVVVLHFWAAWCPPCLEEIPPIIELARAYEDKPLKVVAVSLDEKWEDALKVLPAKGLPRNLVSLLDTTTKLPDRYGTYQYPETYLLDSDLRIVSKWVGAQPWATAEVRQVIDRELSRAKGS